MKRLLLGVALATALAGASVSAAGKTSSSIALNTPLAYSAPTTSSWPHFGDSVTFTTAYPDTFNKYWVYINVLCYQLVGSDHVLVYASTQKPDATFYLGGTPSPWVPNGGPATCIANLFYWSNGGKYTVLADTDFEVN